MLLEPEAGAGLWPKVRAKTGWIESNEDTIRLLAGDWRRADAAFQQAAGHSLGSLNAAWNDPTSGQYSGQVSAGLAHAAEQGSGMSALAQRVDAFAETVIDVKKSIRDTIALNDPIYGVLGMLPGGLGAAAQTVFADQVAQIVDNTIDTAANNISGQAPITFQQPLKPLTGPPPGVKPKDWWAGLSSEDKRRYINERPDLVAGMDGLPTEARDDANRLLLRREIERLERDLHDGSNPWSSDAINARRKEMVELLQQLGNDTPYNPDEPPGNGQKFYLLGFDPEGDGRAIVARGNPDIAEDVATLVPGIMNDITTVGGYQGKDEQNLLQRIDALHTSALEGGSKSASVIGWLDYDAPDNIGTFDRAQAEAAKADLTAFQQGLRESHVGPRSHNTIIGHSYGALVAGIAADDGDLMVDDLVTVGSLGTGAEHASELNVPRVWATEHDGDGIADWAYHGQDPTDLRFGANVFESDSGPDVPIRSTEHSAAFDDVRGEDGTQRNVGLRNLGSIIAAGPNEIEKYPEILKRNPTIDNPRFPWIKNYDPP